jgi:hypothetical protein
MKTFCLALLVILCIGTQAQKTNTSKLPGRTAFYAEIGGPGILFSANIDSRFKPSLYNWGFRAGLGS